MYIGYVRVPTDDQNLALQEDALKEAGCERIFYDKVSGAKSVRPGLKDALDYLRDGQDPVDTSSPSGVRLFHIFGALAEFERNLARVQTIAGIAAARAIGKKGGRRRTSKEEQDQRLYQLFNGADTVKISERQSLIIIGGSPCVY